MQILTLERILGEGVNKLSGGILKVREKQWPTLNRYSRSSLADNGGRAQWAPESGHDRVDIDRTPAS